MISGAKTGFRYQKYSWTLILGGAFVILKNSKVLQVHYEPKIISGMKSNFRYPIKKCNV